MGRTSIGVVALFTLLAPLCPQGTVDWEQHGRALLQDLGETAAPSLNELLDRHYVQFAIGDFDLRLPKSMVAKTDEAPRIAALVSAMLDLQARLDELTVNDPAVSKNNAAEIASLRKVVATWRKQPVSFASAAVGKRASRSLVILAPDRRNFAGLVGWLGLARPFYREVWWNDGTATFSELRLPDEGDAQVVALEYAAPGPNSDVTRGFDMNTREKTGMLQHLLQRSAMSWCWHHLGDRADLSFVLGFTTDLVIDILGENNARSGGSGKSKSTEGLEGFVPGAPSRGGSIVMVNADSGWRQSLGKEYFSRVLRQAQRAGERDAPDSADKLGHFLLRAVKGEKTFRVDAPFLGKVAYERESVPEQFLDDYMEFHRAYRAAFVHWLQTKAGKTKSAEKYQSLMLRSMQPKEGDTFEAICKEIWGLPLASKAADADTLERRFLAWLVESSR